jgi:hypothetical protein
MEKSHKNNIEHHKNKLEQNHGFRCQREYPVPRGGFIHRLDLGCFREKNNPSAVGLEVESNNNFNSPQIRSNAEDLQEFKRIHPDSKVFHIHTNQAIDFSKEIDTNKNITPFTKTEPKREFRKWGVR